MPSPMMKMPEPDEMAVGASSTDPTCTRRGKSSGTDWVVHDPGASAAAAESAAASSPSPSSLPHVLLDGAARTALFVSPQTGLRGLVLTTDEPLCTLHIVLATEAVTNGWSHKDDGLPHTLEHAVFLGSEKFPYKGILDKLANRSLADGTNAWTATDHTAYTLTTAGSEGVLNLLPIYADHILHPTLTPQSFVTEIHHVTAEGKDKGVVYCEMQGRENTDGSLVDRALLGLLYPDPDPHGAGNAGGCDDDAAKSCGYSAETGGKMSNLRMLTNEQVIRYHTENYTADNALFVLSGNVTGDEFFEALDLVEMSVREKPREKMGSEVEAEAESTRVDRPWHRSVVPPMDLTATGVMPPMITASTTELVADSGNAPNSTGSPKPHELSFPSEDETRGTISLGWRGPPYSQRKEWLHLRLLWRYLTESAASPLQKIFVECVDEDPICAHVSPAHEVFTEGYHQLWFSEVEVERMDEVLPMLKGALIDARNDFDLDRMKTVVRRYRRRLLERAERRPTDALIDEVIRNFLYGPRDMSSLEEEVKVLKDDADELSLLDGALTNSAETWIGVLDEYVLSQPYGAVIGKPSSQLATTMAEQEKEREEQQAKDLGTDKLKRLGEELEAAIEYNEREIPEDVLTSVPVPSLEGVKPIPLLTVRGAARPAQEDGGFAVAPNSGRGVSAEDVTTVVGALRASARDAGSDEASPFYTDWNHIHSAFVSVAVSLSTKSLSAPQRLYLPLLLEIAFKLPATLDDGTALSKDEFVSQLQDDTVSYAANAGLLGSSIPQMISFKVQVEANPTDGSSGFEKALRWIRRVLFLTKFTTDTVKVAVQRLASEIPPQIRDGPTVVRAVGAELAYDPEVSNMVAESPLRQKPFLAGLLKRMEEDDDEENEAARQIVTELETIRSELVQPHNMQVFVAGNVGRIPRPMETLAEALTFPPSSSGQTPSSPPSTSATGGRLIGDVSASTALRAGGGRAAVCALSAVESGFLGASAPGVGSYDPNHASLLVAIEYLTALEGDFWVKIRGAGLSYGSSIRNSTDSKLLRFSLYRCTDVAAAFEAAAQILVDYASGKAKISPVGLENAESSLAYNIIAGSSTKLSAAQHAFIGNYEGKGVDYDQWLLSQIGGVTEEQAMHSLVTYLVPIFDPSSNLVVACPTNKMDEVAEYFVTRGWTGLEKVPEEQLCTVFAGEQVREDPEEGAKLPDKVAGVSMFLPGAFASQFQCGCPKCGR